MAGTVVVDTLKSGTSGPPAFRNTSDVEVGQLCRAWVNFAGGTGAINASFNVSSVTRNGTGLYTVSFTNAMPDINYVVAGFSRNNANTARILVCASSQLTTISTSQIGLTVGEYANNVDSTAVGVAFFR